VLITDAVLCVCVNVVARRSGAKEWISVRYAIAIPAIAACVFFVYVLIQFRRDEKGHDSRSSRPRLSSDGPLELDSCTAVRKPGHSFAEWSRLSQRRCAPEAGVVKFSARKQNKVRSKLARVPESALALASGDAPSLEEREKQAGAFPKKIA
jgi:hypothetical protein